MAAVSSDDRRSGLLFDRGDLSDSEFQLVALRDAWFRNADMSGARMRGVLLTDADIDGEIDGLRVNGIEVAPLVEAELDRRHPERAVFHTTDLAELRAGWATLEAMWDATLARVASMEPGTEDVSVDGEWSFTETLRHLVLATDAWLGSAILGKELPFHPIGVLFTEAAGHEAELGIDPTASPTYAEVLDVRAGRVAMVRDFLADVAPSELDEPRPNPWDRDHEMTVLDCLRVIFNEEWCHHRFASRDLDAIELGLA